MYSEDDAVRLVLANCPAARYREQKALVGVLSGRLSVAAGADAAKLKLRDMLRLVTRAAPEWRPSLADVGAASPLTREEFDARFARLPIKLYGSRRPGPKTRGDKPFERIYNEQRSEERRGALYRALLSVLFSGESPVDAALQEYIGNNLVYKALRLVAPEGRCPCCGRRLPR